MDVEHDSGSYKSNKDCLLLGWDEWALHSSSGVVVLGLLGDDVVHVLREEGRTRRRPRCTLPAPFPERKPEGIVWWRDNVYGYCSPLFFAYDPISRRI